MAGDPVVLTYTHDIKPLFRDSDIACMAKRGIKLGDANWMCVLANANNVYQAVSSGFMPPDGAWAQDKVDIFKAWIDGGLKP